MGNVYLPGLVSQKYDAKLDYPITMYDNLPYKRDSDFCGSRQVAMYSGHILKYYLCMNESEAYKVDNRDGEIDEILAAVKRKEEKRIREAEADGSENDSPQAPTQQQKIQAILKDDASESADAPAGAVNAFEGVEDW